LIGYYHRGGDEMDEMDRVGGEEEDLRFETWNLRGRDWPLHMDG
jgi:hypothetical protein